MPVSDSCKKLLPDMRARRVSISTMSKGWHTACSTAISYMSSRHILRQLCACFMMIALSHTYLTSYKPTTAGGFQSKSWGIGFAIPAVAMVIAVLIFMSGHKYYTHVKPTGSPLERALDLSFHSFLYWLRNPCGAGPIAAYTPPRPADVRYLPPPPCFQVL
jgi:POT family